MTIDDLVVKHNNLVDKIVDTNKRLIAVQHELFRETYKQYRDYVNYYLLSRDKRHKTLVRINNYFKYRAFGVLLFIFNKTFDYEQVFQNSTVRPKIRIRKRFMIRGISKEHMMKSEYKYGDVKYIN